MECHNFDSRPLKKFTVFFLNTKYSFDLTRNQHRYDQVLKFAFKEKQLNYNKQFHFSYAVVLRDSTTVLYNPLVNQVCKQNQREYRTNVKLSVLVNLAKWIVENKISDEKKKNSIKITAGGCGGCGVGLLPGKVTFHRSPGKSLGSPHSKVAMQSSLLVNVDAGITSMTESWGKKKQLEHSNKIEFQQEFEFDTNFVLINSTNTNFKIQSQSNVSTKRQSQSFDFGRLIQFD